MFEAIKSWISRRRYDIPHTRQFRDQILLYRQVEFIFGKHHANIYVGRAYVEKNAMMHYLTQEEVIRVQTTFLPIHSAFYMFAKLNTITDEHIDFTPAAIDAIEEKLADNPAQAIYLLQMISSGMPFHAAERMLFAIKRVVKPEFVYAQLFDLRTVDDAAEYIEQLFELARIRLHE